MSRQNALGFFVKSQLGGHQMSKLLKDSFFVILNEVKDLKL